MKLQNAMIIATALALTCCGGKGSATEKHGRDTSVQDTSQRQNPEAQDKKSGDNKGQDKSDETGSGFGAWEKAENGTKIRRNYNMEKNLGGTRYVYYSSYSSGSSGGSSTETKIQLCSNMTVTAYEQSSVSVYVEGADGNSSSEESDDGTWQFWEDDQGGQYIQFFFRKQGPSVAVYRKEGNKVRLGDRLYHVTKANCN